MSQMKIQTPEAQTNETIDEVQQKLKEHSITLRWNKERTMFLITAEGIFGGVKINQIRSKFTEYFPDAKEIA